MCVICHKPKDVRFPSEKNIGEMWKANPDGAGIMWREENGTVSFAKGFMKLKEFEKFIADNRDRLEHAECALHFRITTHGGTSKGNCHPFVVDSAADPHLLTGNAKRILMHNGVLPLVPRRKDISDSAELALRIGRYVNPSAPMEDMDELFGGSRILLMDEDGTHFYGDAFKKSEDKENDGLLYSNLTWESRGLFGLSGFGWSDTNYDGEPATQKFDYANGVFVDAKTGKELDIDSVDPYALSAEDEEIYWEMTAEEGEIDEVCEKFQISRETAYDLEFEAEVAGMSLRDYVAQLFEPSAVAACSV